MQTDTFSGPLFIVGRPRSGTTLLRSLLNEHPKTGIPITETLFIPYMVARFGNPPQLHLDGRFDKFYSEFTHTDFFYYMEREGHILDKAQLLQKADIRSWSSIFETILKFYTSKRVDGDFIWGDKSPQYMNHMPLLKALFPQARFLHIIRDPRDHCLSVQNSWGRNVFRAAEQWREEVKRARIVGQQLGGDYKEVLYESLLSDPQRVLADICDFLKLEFCPTMLKLSQSYESHGDAAGQLKIVSSNQKKYLHKLPPSVIKRIEEIVYPTAHSCGYDFEYDVKFKPLNSVELKFFKLYDSLALTRYYINRRGLYQGLRYFYLKVKDNVLSFR